MHWWNILFKKYLYVHLSVLISVRLYVRIRVRSVTFFFCFDIVSLYLAQGCITLSRWIAYIHAPDTTLTFDRRVKFMEFDISIWIQTSTFFFFFALALLNHIWHMKGCEVYIHDLDTTLNFDPKVSIRLTKHHLWRIMSLKGSYKQTPYVKYIW